MQIPDNISYSKKLKIVRIIHGLSVEGAAAVIMVSEKAWRNWEAGTNNPIGALRNKISEKFPEIA